MTDTTRAKIRDDSERVGFCALNWLVVLDPTLSDGAKITYCVLKRHAIKNDEVWPSQTYVAKVRGAGLRTIRRHIAELLARKLITVDPPSLPTRKSNTYWFESPSSVNGEAAIAFAERIPDGHEIDALVEAYRAEVGAPPLVDDDSAVEEGMGPEMASTPRPKVASTPVSKMASKERLNLEEDEGQERLRRTKPLPTDARAVGDTPRDSGVEGSSARDAARQVGADPRFEGPAPPKQKTSSTGAKPRRKKLVPVLISEAETEAPVSLPVRTDKPFVPKDTTPASAATVVDPAHPDQVLSLWLTEMRTHDPRFGGGHALMGSARDQAIAQQLLDRFPPSVSGDLLTKLIRVAIWDWPAIQASIDVWYTKDKPIPTVKEILYLADKLVAFVETGVCAPPRFRESRYKKRWFKDEVKAAAQMDAIQLRAKAEGKTRAEVCEDMREEEKAARQARRIAAGG